MSVPKHLGITILLGSLLAACTSAPKKTAEEPTASAENDELVKMAKERAAQGGVKAKDEKEKITAAIDTSLEPELPPPTEAQKKLAAPVMQEYLQAVALMKAQKYNEAFAQFDLIQDKVPMFLGPVLNQALIRIQQKNYKEAGLILKKATGINQKNPYIYNLQGYILRQQGKFAEARTAYEKALEISPKYAKAHYNLGVLADLYQQDLPFALQHYEAYQALQSKPDVTVAKWVVDLQKRTGVYKPPAKPVKTEEVTVEGSPAADGAAPAPVDGQAPAPAADGTAQAAPAAEGSAPSATPAADSTAPAAATTDVAPSAAQPAADSKKAKVKNKKGKKGQTETTVTTEAVKPAEPAAAPASEATAATPAAAADSSAPAPAPNAEGATPAATPAVDAAATATVTTSASQAPQSTPDDKKAKTKSKKAIKDKKGSKNVSADTAPPASEPVKSASPASEPATTTGAQP